MRAFLAILILSVFMGACTDASVRYYRLEVVAEYPHDTESYTQGLFFHEGQMYETTGLHGKSTLRKVDLNTGKPIIKLDFGQKYFVEGSVVLNDNLYILTWESKVVFVYDANSLKYKSTWSYPREGWGLTTDGKQLIASEGSSILYFMDEKFSLKRRVYVKHEDRPLMWLNEL